MHSPGDRVKLATIARSFGVLYLLTFITSIPALLLYEPALRNPVAFVAGDGNVNNIYLGALLDVARRIFNNRLGDSQGLLRQLRREVRRG